MLPGSLPKKRRRTLRCLGFRGDFREGNGKERATGDVFTADGPVHIPFDDHLGHVKADAGTASFFFGGEIGIEYLIDDGGIDTAAIVADLDQDILILGRDQEVDMAVIDVVVGDHGIFGIGEDI